jgi:hypothetical protein
MGAESSKQKIHELELTIARLQTKNEDLLRQVQEARLSDEKARKELEEVRNAPLREKQKQVDALNALEIPLNYTNKVAFVGPKGSFKSTFKWIIGKGPKPSKASAEGEGDAVRFDFSLDFLDTITMSWSNENVYKLAVIFIVHGFPRDIVAFSNDVVVQVATSLAAIGLLSPIFCVMNASYWDFVDEGQVDATTGIGDEKCMYNLNAYHMIQEAGLGLTIKHHQDPFALSQSRGLDHFATIRRELGEDQLVFKAEGQSEFMDVIMALLHAFIFKYKRDQVRFMKYCKLANVGFGREE